MRGVNLGWGVLAMGGGGELSWGSHLGQRGLVGEGVPARVGVLWSNGWVGSYGCMGDTGEGVLWVGGPRRGGPMGWGGPMGAWGFLGASHGWGDP